ncbi:MAG: class I SAM-dependent methyltransferase [Zoogloeaceae bacterium]|jgi:SAM-dependent methyltransferase|nr:class I SAM-dependent methyltransferase [Zoogloeaceae bacterium]
MSAKPATVVDLGSQCVPGQEDTYKVFFQDKSRFNYIGVDMVNGYNVDIVLSQPYVWNEIPDNFCDVLISGQVFEHVEFPWITIREIARVVKPDGLICIIVPSMQSLHRYPVNCQNYFADGMIALSKWAGILPLHCSTNLAPIGENSEWYSDIEDTILVAKNSKHILDNLNVMDYTCEPADLNKMATGFISAMEQPYWINWIYRMKEIIKIQYRRIIPETIRIWIRKWILSKLFSR